MAQQVRNVTNIIINDATSALSTLGAENLNAGESSFEYDMSNDASLEINMVPSPYVGQSLYEEEDERKEKEERTNIEKTIPKLKEDNMEEIEEKEE